MVRKQDPEKSPCRVIPLLPFCCLAFASRGMAALPPSLDDVDADAGWLGEAAYDYAGRTVSGNCDVDGDGFADLLVGAYGSDDGASGAGETYLLLGGATRWSGDASLVDADASWVGLDSGEYTSLELGLAPDLDGDGYDDIAIATYKNSDVAYEAGKLYLVYGASGGWSADTSLSLADATWLGEAEEDHAGRSVSGLGDVDGDGFGDLMVAGCWNSTAATQAGQAYLLLGGGRWSGSTSLAYADASYLGEDAYDYAGRSVAGLGDTDGDGLADLAIGAYGRDEPADGAGETYIILGRSSGWASGQALEDSADASFLGESADDRSGLTVAAAGDVDGDGYSDLLICAYRWGSTDQGAVYLLLGQAGGWAPDSDLASADAVYSGEDAYDYAGKGASGLGDVDADGFGDILIGATGADDGAADGGRAYLVLGSATPSDMSLASADTIITGTASESELAYALTWAGDLDGGGYPELLLPAYHDSSAGSQAGIVRIFYAEPWFDEDGDGYTVLDGDCDDGDPSIHPGAKEIPYDGIDQDCDGADSLDADGDGYDSDHHGGDDCDDQDPSVHPGCEERCLDGADNDCDGTIDWADADGDGDNDCEELCVDSGLDPDQDGDGAVREDCGGNDCDDGDASIYPCAVETAYDGVDQDCDGSDLTDVDGDGHDAEDGGGYDCDDVDAALYGGAVEIAYDGVDQDCDGGDLTDVDGDGYDAEEAGGDDCDDQDPEINRGAEEDCDDGVDNDCDDVIDGEDADCGATGDTENPCEEPGDTGDTGQEAPEEPAEAEGTEGCSCGASPVRWDLAWLSMLLLTVGIRRSDLKTRHRAKRSTRRRRPDFQPRMALAPRLLTKR